MSEPAPNFRQELEHVQTWARALAEVLGQVTGSPVSTEVASESPMELAPAGAGDLWILCAFSGGLRGELALRLSPASALLLAQIFMNEPIHSEAAVMSERREAVLELLRQIAGFAATSLKTSWGEVQLRLGSSLGAPSWPASSTYWLRAVPVAVPASVIELHLSAALAAALRAPGANATGIGPSPPVPESSAAPQSPVHLDLLMDVELDVTLRFGTRRLLLREVLDLNPGSVVELDREVSEPVEMLLDGRLVARGEVVVLNGCYGLRVTEVAP